MTLPASANSTTSTASAGALVRSAAEPTVASRQGGLIVTYRAMLACCETAMASGGITTIWYARKIDRDPGPLVSKCGAVEGGAMG